MYQYNSLHKKVINYINRLIDCIKCGRIILWIGACGGITLWQLWQNLQYGVAGGITLWSGVAGGFTLWSGVQGGITLWSGAVVGSQFGCTIV